MKKLEKKWMNLMKKLSLSLFSILITLSLLNHSISAEKKIIGKAKVIDGDTIKINGKKIRLSGIDAPELKQQCSNESGLYSCGELSKSILDSIELPGVNIRCTYLNKDKYGRILGTCFRGSIEINKWLVRSGAAVAYKKYSKKYLADEKYAKDKNNGIWNGDFIRPEEWRKKNK